MKKKPLVTKQISLPKDYQFVLDSGTPTYGVWTRIGDLPEGTEIGFFIGRYVPTEEALKRKGGEAMKKATKKPLKKVAKKAKK